MKRVVSAILVVLLLAGALSANMLSYVHAALRMVGDVNNDGKLNNRDLAQLQQALADWDVTLDGDADLNADGKVNNRDLSQLQQTLSDNEKQPKAVAATTYVSLGAPAAEHYPSNRLARCAWDMIIHDGRLYVGCGDYSKNTGDSPVLSCSLNDLGNWTVEAVLPDEQVGRFVNINGVLTIPGFDPVGSPDYGFYYERIGGEWRQQQVIPYGLHNFDIVWFHGRMYAAIGADRGAYPIAYTEDGVTYETLPLYKDGSLVDTGNSNVVRCSNLYVLGDELYADFWYEDEALSKSVFEMYRYNEEEDRFDYIADLKTSTHGGKYSPAYLPLWGKETVNNKVFLTTGYLFYTTDFEEYTQVEIPNNATVYDMVRFSGRLYLLTAYEKDGKQQVTIYSTTSANPANLRTEASYTYDLMPTSFAVDADNFFVGMGNWYGSGSSGNGTILQIER